MMDAVTKATEALTQHMLDHAPPGQRPDPVAVEAMTRVVLAAVGYPAHQSSDEGTCWCPVAEQAGRERDALRVERDELRGALRQVLRRHHPLWGTRETWTGGLAGPDDIARWLDALDDAEVHATLEAKWQEYERDAARAALNAKETP